MNSFAFFFFTQDFNLKLHFYYWLNISTPVCVGKNLLSTSVHFLSFFACGNATDSSILIARAWGSFGEEILADVFVPSLFCLNSTDIQNTMNQGKDSFP